MTGSRSSTIAGAITRESRVQITLVITMLAMSASAAWWASSITATVATISDNQIKFGAVLDTLIQGQWSRAEQTQYARDMDDEIDKIVRRLNSIDQRISRLEGSNQ